MKRGRFARSKEQRQKIVLYTEKYRNIAETEALCSNRENADMEVFVFSERIDWRLFCRIIIQRHKRTMLYTIR